MVPRSTLSSLERPRSRSWPRIRSIYRIRRLYIPLDLSRSSSWSCCGCRSYSRSSGSHSYKVSRTQYSFRLLICRKTHPNPNFHSETIVYITNTDITQLHSSPGPPGADHLTLPYYTSYFPLDSIAPAFTSRNRPHINAKHLSARTLHVSNRRALLETPS